jgi:hypothetical protein
MHESGSSEGDGCDVGSRTCSNEEVTASPIALHCIKLMMCLRLGLSHVHLQLYAYNRTTTTLHHLYSPLKTMEAPVTRASFLGLPPGLRNAVYKLLLTSVEPLDVAILTPMYSQFKCQSPIELTRTPCTNRRIEGSNLLRANKLIYKEAIEILYGDNIFLFKEPQALRIFAFYIGDNKSKLRHVRLQIGRARTTRAALKALHPTPNLRHLDLGRFLNETDRCRMLVKLHGDEGMREAAVAFADVGLTVDECEARFAATRICAIDKVSGEWEVFVE